MISDEKLKALIDQASKSILRDTVVKEPRKRTRMVRGRAVPYIPEPKPLKGVKPGRYTAGVYPEDIAYLVSVYFNRVKRGDIKEDELTPISQETVLKLQQMAGIPAKRITNDMHNDVSASKIQKMLNDAADDKWHFNVQAHAQQFGNRSTRYKVTETGKIGGKRFADVLDI